MDENLIIRYFLAFRSFLNLYGSLLNGLLLYLAVFKSPKQIRVYSVIIANFALTDFISNITDLLVQQRHIPAGTSLVYISYGPCTYSGPFTCYFFYALMLHALGHSQWSLLFSFGYRYYILFGNNETRLKIFLKLLLFYVPSLLQLITFLIAYDNPEDVTQLLATVFPSYIGNYTITGNLSIFEPFMLYTIVYMVVPPVPMYLAILFYRSRIIRYLNKNTKMMSKESKVMHRLMLKALTYQATLPGFFLIGIISYVIGQLHIYNGAIQELFTLTPTTFITILSPLLYMYLVRGYRNQLKKWFLRLPFVKKSMVDIEPTNSNVGRVSVFVTSRRSTLQF